MFGVVLIVLCQNRQHLILFVYCSPCGIYDNFEMNF